MRADFEFLLNAGEKYHLSGIAALLAQLVRDQGRDEEALALLTTAEDLSAPNDVQSQALWRFVKAPILARRNEHEQAERLAQAAVDLLTDTELPGLRADALSGLASVMEALGRTDAALEANDRAIDLYSAKGDLFNAAQRSSWGVKLRKRLS